jgi:hypothetical protein
MEREEFLQKYGRFPVLPMGRMNPDSLPCWRRRHVVGTL